MTQTSSVVGSACYGAMYLSDDGALDGWCVYPDQPDERAIVDLVVNGDVVRAMRATRLRLDMRESGFGDGYCGFSFMVSKELQKGGERAVLEVREERLNLTIGRVIFGRRDTAMDRRFDAVAKALAAIESKVDHLRQSAALSDATDGLAKTLLYLAGRSEHERTLGLPGLQACLEQVAAIPAMDLGWRPSPRFSFIVGAGGDPAGLAERIRSVARALAGLEAEFLLVDDGTSGLTALLPTRLRHLALVPVAPSDLPAAALNAAAVMARGEILVFARRGGPRSADLRDALEGARHGKLDVDARLAGRPARAPAKTVRHGLRGIVSRDDFSALGGFDRAPREEDMWAILVAKAEALDLEVAPWAALPAGLLPVA